MKPDLRPEELSVNGTATTLVTGASGYLAGKVM